MYKTMNNGQKEPNLREPYKVGDEVCSICLPYCYGVIDRVWSPAEGGGYDIRVDPQMKKNHFTDGFYINHNECRLQVEVKAYEAEQEYKAAEARWNAATEQLKELRDWVVELRTFYYEALNRSSDADRDLRNYKTPDTLGET